MQRITPCLWFDDQAEEAAKFYTSIFKNSKVTSTSRYGEKGAKVSGRPKGSVLTVAFELDGQSFIALNGGPIFKFNEAVSLMVNCKTQEEVDYYWAKLSEGGDEKAQQCGWLKDRYGVSWQVVPTILQELMGSGDAARSERVMGALLTMKKLDIKVLEQA
jgi:predicted 3-demethylubiquinone-9 3-methyltransferase (glyoxalase superfamily)